MSFRTIAAAAAAAMALSLCAATGAALAATPKWQAPQDAGDARQGQSPIAASDAKGRGIVAWIADVGSGNGQVLARRFTQKDGPQGSIVEVSGVMPFPDPNFTLDRFAAVVAPDGTATVVWRQNDRSLYARRVSAAGALGPVTTLSPPGTVNFGNGVYAAAASDGSVGVTFTHAPESPNASRGQILRIAPNGTPGPAVDLAPGDPTTFRLPAGITADPFNRFWALIGVSYDHDGVDPLDDAGWEVRRLNTDGTTLSPLLTLGRQGGVPTSSCPGGLLTDPAGRLLASYAFQGAGPNNGVRARWVESDGTTLGPETVLDPSTCAPSDLAVTLDTAGVVSWTRKRASGGADLVVRSVDSSGKAGPEQLLASGGSVPPIAYSELATAGGRGVEALYIGASGNLFGRGLTPTSALGAEQQIAGAPAIQPSITATTPASYAGAWIGNGLIVRMARTVSTAKPPSARVSLDADDAGRALLRATIATKAPKDPLAAEQFVTLTLPSKLKWAKKAVRRIMVRADGKVINGAATISGQTLTMTLPQTAAKSVAVQTQGGALTLGSSLNCPSSVKPGKTCRIPLSFVARVTDVSAEKGTAKTTAKLLLLVT